jgi:hypothetical protein
MRQVKKSVTVRELYDILCAISTREKKESPDWEGFIYQLSVAFLRAPTMEFRFHDIRDNVDYTYIIKHQDIASALANPGPPKVDDAL